MMKLNHGAYECIARGNMLIHMRDSKFLHTKQCSKEIAEEKNATTIFIDTCEEKECCASSRSTLLGCDCTDVLFQDHGSDRE